MLASNIVWTAPIQLMPGRGPVKPEPIAIAISLIRFSNNPSNLLTFGSNQVNQLHPNPALHLAEVWPILSTRGAKYL